MDEVENHFTSKRKAREGFVRKTNAVHRQTACEYTPIFKTPSAEGPKRKRSPICQPIINLK